MSELSKSQSSGLDHNLSKTELIEYAISVELNKLQAKLKSAEFDLANHEINTCIERSVLEKKISNLFNKEMNIAVREANSKLLELITGKFKTNIIFNGPFIPYHETKIFEDLEDSIGDIEVHTNEALIVQVGKSEISLRKDLETEIIVKYYNYSGVNLPVQTPEIQFLKRVPLPEIQFSKAYQEAKTKWNEIESKTNSLQGVIDSIKLRSSKVKASPELIKAKVIRDILGGTDEGKQILHSLDTLDFDNILGLNSNDETTNSQENQNGQNQLGQGAEEKE